MMLLTNVRIALESLRSARWRTFLTMLGVIIGVSSVVTTVSLGEGIKSQVLKEINHLGSDLLTITQKSTGTASSSRGYDLFESATTNTLTQADAERIRTLANVRFTAPAHFLSGILTNTYDKEVTPLEDTLVIASNDQIAQVLNQNVQYGEFFNDESANHNVVVIGRTLADKLFQELSPVGKTMNINGKSFLVKGVIEFYPVNPLNLGVDYNSVAYIPTKAGMELSGGTLTIGRIFVKVSDQAAISQTKQAIRAQLLAARAGREDFSVVEQSEYMETVDQVFNMITGLIAGVAAISLVVGGIGIMNIMLVSVTERTREIGVRKAIGGTNRQIMHQFLIEAIVISVVGGMIGIILSGIIAGSLRVFTDLTPVISLPVIGIAGGVSVLVGIVFGVTPAYKAARKDPITALRHD